jgi:hypothetical protein
MPASFSNGTPPSQAQKLRKIKHQRRRHYYYKTLLREPELSPFRKRTREKEWEIVSFPEGNHA